MSEKPDAAYLRRLKRAILNLPRLQRDIFLASRFGGLSYAQIGHRIGLTPQEVEQEIAKAIWIIDRELSRHGLP